MALTVNPTLPVSAPAQVGAVSPQLVLQPGTVVNAQVQTLLAQNLVRIAIANLSLDVMTEVPLQAGQTLQLAVSQTDSGIRLAMVGQGGSSSSAASTAGQATINSVANAAPAVQPQAVDVLTPIERIAVSLAAGQAVTRQQSLAPLFADLGVAATLDNLPPDVKQAVQQVLAQQTPLAPNLSAADIQEAFQSSGLFLEASLASGSAPAGAVPDLKAALIVLRQALTSLEQTIAQAPHAPQSQTAAPATPLPGATPAAPTPAAGAAVTGTAIPVPTAGGAPAVAVASSSPGAVAQVPGAPTASGTPQALPPGAAAPAPASTPLPSTSTASAPAPGSVPVAPPPAGQPATAPPAPALAISGPGTPAAAASAAAASLSAAQPQGGGAPSVSQPPAAPVAAAAIVLAPEASTDPVQPQARAAMPSGPRGEPADQQALTNAAAGKLVLTDALLKAAPHAASTAAVLTLLQEALQELPRAGGNGTARMPQPGTGDPLQATTPPPVRGGLPSAQPVASPSIAPDTPLATTAHRLIEDTDAALARQTLLQIASLPDRVDQPASGTDPTAPRWNFEIPFATQQGTAMAQFEIARDGSGSDTDASGRVWRARFTLNVEPAGPVHALISLSGERTSVRMWAERPATAAALKAGAGELSAALARAELTPGDITVREGAPPQPAPAKAGHFLDRAL